MKRERCGGWEGEMERETERDGERVMGIRGE